MALSVIVQAFGWVAVIGLIAVHLLIHQGRLHRGGSAPRVAGAFAALIIVIAGLLAEIWPVFVLGLLWLRSELWHRHSPDEAWFPLPGEPLYLPEAEITRESHKAGRRPGTPPASPAPAGHPPAAHHPDLRPPAHAGGTETRPRTTIPAARTGSRLAPVRAHTRPAGRTEPDEHHRRLVPLRVVDVLFRIEMTLLIAVTIGAFAFWAYQERPGFEKRADDSLCSLMGGC